jgi:cupredoxin-like protein
MPHRQFPPPACADMTRQALTNPRRRTPGRIGAWIVAIPLLLTISAEAQAPTISVTIRNHKFVPEQIEVPANQKVEVHVINADPTPAEFESFELRREKVVAAGQEIILYVGPLKPGSYEFFDDFNPSARGHVVAR